MMDKKLVIAMVGLPARGKSTMARKIVGTLKLDEVNVRIFNNGDVRRRLSRGNTSGPELFSPENPAGVKFRDKCARINLESARDFLRNAGEVAIIDAANVTCRRRKLIKEIFPDLPVLFIECMNTDEEALEANLQRKASLKEFSHLSRRQALESFLRRIDFYERVYEPLNEERNFILIDSFEGFILQEKLTDLLPYYDRIRDLITTRIVRNLFLVRHGETYFNQENRIGGDSELTGKGLVQARGLAEYFAAERIPIIFTSNYKRTLQTAAPIAAKQEHCSIIALPEFNEIHAGVCEGMTYAEISERMPEVAAGRKNNKYDYVYPDGESYAAMEERIHRGLQKVFYLNNYDDNIMIVGHRAGNRMILSDFVFRPREEVPYIYMPQNRYYHIQIDPHKKIFELKPYVKRPSL
ncbi:MAG: 6-phosphofructo-2-kinase/fructose-2,6-bisphosphatase [Desulfurivibrionaceae bacterium]|nr:6-phosphofructo-2-kinase/fructose-2,6-bisphosphatase [Desulfobulbales bacterium]MDT8335086.1 6-phosphofructo-2-kinase/fructose-2,6-bisphosphatase [Desulfurivibrionaceae bacterium]